MPDLNPVTLYRVRVEGKDRLCHVTGTGPFPQVSIKLLDGTNSIALEEDLTALKRHPEEGAKVSRKQSIQNWKDSCRIIHLAAERVVGGDFSSEFSWRTTTTGLRVEGAYTVVAVDGSERLLGDVKFSLFFKRGECLNKFRLHFHTPQGQRLVRTYGLREHLDEVWSTALLLVSEDLGLKDLFHVSMFSESNS